jgi:hypothetical protein
LEIVCPGALAAGRIAFGFPATPRFFENSLFFPVVGPDIFLFFKT